MHEFLSLCERYDLTFHLIVDRKGVTLRARGSRVEFDSKTMAWLWLLGFAGWSAFRLHGVHFFLRALTGKSFSQLKAEDRHYAEDESAHETILYVIRDLAAVESLDPRSEDWPQQVPRPQPTKTGLHIEQQGAFDLVMIAVTYMLLHEIRHVMFQKDGGRPSAAVEESECDAFARGFLLGNLEEYARGSGQSANEILAKRAAGIALGTYALYQFTTETVRAGSSEYPPIADRLKCLFPDVDLPPYHWFWDFAASLLAAIVIRRNPDSTMPDLNGQSLCLALVEMVRKAQ